MTVYVNEKPCQVEEGTSLASLMEHMGIEPRGVAVAIAYEVVLKDQWAETVLTDKMELMLIHAVSGG